MKIIGNKFRSFYPQSSLNFNFKVSNYTSNDFEIGVSGSDYINFKFKSGIIRDHYNNIIGTFNKEPINIDAYIKEPFVAGAYSTNASIYKSYLNEKPIIRNSILANPTSVFDSIVAKILGGTNDSLDLEFTLKGEKIPVLEFTKFHSNSTSFIGTVTNKGDKYVEIFSITSQSVGGTWTYPKQLAPGVPYIFKNEILNTFAINSRVILNFETNFGKASYELYIGDPLRVELSTTPVTTTIITNLNFRPKISLLGNPLSNDGTSEAIYQIDYLLSNPSDKIDLLFEYNAGVPNQSLSKTITTTKDIYFSGVLPSIQGKGFGNLYNKDYSTIIEDYKIDEFPDNTQDILFFATKELQESFSNLNATGEVLYGVNNFSEDLISISLNDVNLNVNYYMDLGGKTGIPHILESQEKIYKKIDNYKGLSVGTIFEQFTITGIVIDQKDEGAYYFDNVEIPMESGVLQNTISYPSITMGSDAEITTTIYPYRGVGYANLNDQYVILKGETKNSKTPFLFINPLSDNILFKNLSNIDYNGRYTLKSNDLIKAKVFSSSSFYRKQGLNFNYNTAKVTASNLINNIISDGIKAYNNLTPFENLNNSENQLYRVQEESEFLMQPNVNWDDNNLVFLSYGQGVFYSDSPVLNLGMIFNDSEFTKNRTLNEIKSKNRIKSASQIGKSVPPPV